MIAVYIAGPIHSPIPDVDKEELKGRFGSLQKWLKANYGHWMTVNPLLVDAQCDGRCQEHSRTSHPSGEGHTWECWMRWDIVAMLACEAIVMLPGWEESNGAVTEFELAKRMHMMIYYAEIKEDPETGAMEWSIT